MKLCYTTAQPDTSHVADSPRIQEYGFRSALLAESGTAHIGAVALTRWQRGLRAPDPLLLDAGTAGELAITGLRLALTAALLLIPPQALAGGALRVAGRPAERPARSGHCHVNVRARRSRAPYALDRGDEQPPRRLPRSLRLALVLLGSFGGRQ